jgi:hypothetical protein
MDDHRVDVLRRGDKSGNNMVIRVRLSSGREIYGFATENVYGGYWDLGPTWNYVITGERLFLWHSGRRGMGPRLPDRYREAQEIYGGYFEPKLLKGFGMLMAVNEVVSHCELIEISGGAE